MILSQTSESRRHLRTDIRHLKGVIRVVVRSPERHLLARLEAHQELAALSVRAVVLLQALRHATSTFWKALSSPGHSFFEILNRGAFSDSSLKLSVKRGLRDDLAFQQSGSLSSGREVV